MCSFLVQFHDNLSTLLGAYDYSYNENRTIRPVEISFTQYSQVVLNIAHKSFVFNSGAVNTSEWGLIRH